MIYLFYSILVYFFSVFIYLLNVKDYIYEYSCDGYDKIEKEYDYIVVGAGSAGSVVALRLSENVKDTVLLVETGPDTSFPLSIPAVAPLLQGSEYDWKYKTVPQTNACLALDHRRSSWPMGQVVGGTSILNNLIYLRGHRYDFDKWAAAGNPGWGYNEESRYYFRIAENQLGAYRNDSLYHGRRGLMPVCDLEFTSQLGDAVIAAAKALGFNTGDLNGRLDSGFMAAQVNTFEGSRFTVGAIIKQLTERYLPNLRLLTRATVDKVLFRKHLEADSVIIRRLGHRIRVRARKSIILSAGVIGSPAILLRSGIGPRNHLNGLGIPVRKDLPVGENLQDHVTTGLDLVLLNQPLNFNLSVMLKWQSMAAYYLNGTGPWTFPGCEAVGLAHSSHSEVGVDPPDIELMVMPAGLSSDGGGHLRHSVGVSHETWRSYFAPLVGQQVASILPVLLRPESRGSVRLRSRRFDDAPIIDPQYLTVRRDVDIIIQGIALVKRLLSTPPMVALGAKLNRTPFPGCEGYKFDTRPYWECYVRHLTLTAFHPVGTCSMGPLGDPAAVVSSRLRVHGTHRLHVIDASVIPTLPSGNVNAAVVMVAERGVALLRDMWAKQKGPLAVAPESCAPVDIFFPHKHALPGMPMRPVKPVDPAS